MSSIADLHFERYLTMQLLPVFYVLLLLGVILVFAVINIVAFWFSNLIGLVMLLVITPIGLLIAFAVVRAVLEFLVMAYRIMQTVHRMDRIPEQVDNLNNKVDGISEDLLEFKAGLVDIRHTIGFLKPISKILRF
ncbi:MAG: DUF4282 domain-containing protein [Moraxellaceae bacterium]|nr:DUF4282 domain-containing protein [Moraxellaceae bacterium]MDZ4298611.1 DUF4282 domain-containing protein [Moraxellaceae bacterium]MDZ4385880.1 DUF4282 domain-containing protein [Moraxellaceae bacterium]